MTRPDLFALARAAEGSGDGDAWRRLWQTLAGTTLALPLAGTAGETIAPRLCPDTGAVLAYPGLDALAADLTDAADSAEATGAVLAGMLAPEGLALAVIGPDGRLDVPAETLAWIAATYGAPVETEDRAGVALTRPAAPDAALLQAVGETVAALGAACREAWLTSMAEAGKAPDLVLILGLDGTAGAAEAEIAEAVTRAVQAMTETPLAVACPAPDSALMAAARRHGIGIATG